VTLVTVVGQLLLILALMLSVAIVLLVGRDRLVRTRREYRERFASVAPYVGLLAVVLVANKVARDIGPQLSWLIGWNITPYIHRLDGLFLWPLYPTDTPQVVVWLQSMATPQLTAYFAFIYVYGYVFLLVFPLIAYFVLPRAEPLRRTIVAYGTNYVIGVVCYVVFIAYGPRNLIADSVQQLLYDPYPQYHFLTSTVNTNTNVFPSLHTSMAVTAALLAWTTREEYPLWTPIAAFFSASVIVATMYLGIHWATDVFFGIVLAWISVRIGCRFEETPPEFDGFKARLRAVRNGIL
jgi:membrane-associated phospholipid phosphatase